MADAPKKDRKRRRRKRATVRIGGTSQSNFANASMSDTLKQKQRQGLQHDQGEHASKRTQPKDEAEQPEADQ